jgi:peptidoglycan hydrolase CwlO-like protein
MKKFGTMLCILTLVLGVSTGCGNKDVSAENIINVEEESSSELEKESETITEINPEIDAYNKKIIAAAMGIEEDDKSITNILKHMYKFEIGTIQNAKADKINNDNVLYITAEDGTEYLIYLWGNDLDCVQDLTNDKWVIRSYR